MAEINSILANVVRTFGFELDEASRKWDEQKVFILWEKKPLIVRLRERV
jgi:hypothetical protein